MAILRSDIEKALDDLISNEEGLKFQSFAVVLAKKRWPDLVACERKKDLGADAIAKAPFAAEGESMVLACSTAATLAKVRSDAEKVKSHFKHISKIIFATPAPVSNQLGEAWVAEIEKDFGYDLAIMSREDFITSLMDPSSLYSGLNSRSGGRLIAKELCQDNRPSITLEHLAENFRAGREHSH